MLYSRFLPPPSAPPLLPPPFPSPPSCSYSSSSSSSCSSPSSSSSYSTFPLALLPSLLPPSLVLLFFLLIPFLFPFPLPSPPLPAPPPHHHHPPLVCYVMQCDVMLWLFTIWLKLCYILVDWIMCLLIEFCVCWILCLLIEICVSWLLLTVMKMGLYVSGTFQQRVCASSTNWRLRPSLVLKRLRQTWRRAKNWKTNGRHLERYIRVFKCRALCFYYDIEHFIALISQSLQ